MIDENKAEKKARSANRDYPVLPLASALEVSDAIRKMGGKASSSHSLSGTLGVKGGALITRITSARRYGLVDKQQLVNTELASKILTPTTPIEAEAAKKEAILSIRLFRDIYERFGKALPEESLFRNILIREFNIPENVMPRILYAVKKNFEILDSKTAAQAFSTITYEGAPPLLKSTGFMIQVRSPHGSSEFDITDEVDWDALDAYLKALKNKWKKKISPE